MRSVATVDGHGWYEGGGAYDGGSCAVSDELSFVVYSSPRSGRGDIWKQSLADGEETRLTHTELFESDVTLCQDNSFMLFGRESANGKQLWRYDFSTGQTLPITQPPLGGYDYKPRFQNDATTVQFIRYPNGIGRDPMLELWESDLNGNREVRIAPLAVWSDQKSRVLVTFDWESRLQRSIVRRLRDGETLAQTSIAGGDVAVSPDGNSFAYIGVPGRRSLWIYDWRTNVEKEAWKPKGYLGIPNYSASGRWITVMDYDSGRSFATLVIIDSSNGNVVKTVDVD